MGRDLSAGKDSCNRCSSNDGCEGRLGETERRTSGNKRLRSQRDPPIPLREGQGKIRERAVGALHVKSGAI